MQGTNDVEIEFGSSSLHVLKMLRGGSALTLWFIDIAPCIYSNYSWKIECYRELKVEELMNLNVLFSYPSTQNEAESEQIFKYRIYRDFLKSLFPFRSFDFIVYY